MIAYIVTRIPLSIATPVIHALGRLGVQSTVIVDTPDALLVADLERSQEVREVVEALNRERLNSYTT